MSLILNGSTQYGYILEALAAGRPLTIAGWAKSNSDSALQAVASLADKDSDVDYRALALFGTVGGDPIVANERDSGDNEWAETSTGYTVGTWFHGLAEFISAGSRKVLIDGGSEDENTVAVSPANLDKAAIGVLCRNSLAWFFNGKLAEIAIWDVILTSQQKADLAAGIEPSNIDPDNQLAYWSLRENANDESGNNKHLTLVGSPTFDAADHPNIISELEADSLDVVSSASGSLGIHNYLLYEQSAIGGEPVELFLFNRDDIEYWSYTSSDSIIVFNGRSYTPVLVRRGDIALDLNSLKTRIEIETDLSNPFARNYIREPLEGKVSLIIYRRQLVSYITYWKGYVQGVKFKSKTAVILGGLKNVSLKRFGLMRKYQRNCGLPLYSTWCGVSEDDSDNYIDGTITSVDGRTIGATIFGTKATDWLLGGKFKTDDGSCLQKIVYHEGNEIKIARAVSALAVGDTFRAWAGCNHLKSTCKTKFNNKLNYGGQPYLPDKNPFTGDAVM